MIGFFFTVLFRFAFTSFSEYIAIKIYPLPKDNSAYLNSIKESHKKINVEDAPEEVNWEFQ